MNRQRNHRGFSLIEVIVSMLVLAIGMVAGLGMIQAGLVGIETGRHLTYTTGLARAQMEEKLSIPYSDLLRQGLEGQDLFDRYTRTWTVEPDIPDTHLATIHTAVEWKDTRGRFHRFQVAAVRAEGVVP
jgi:prepilin-type N-terminal cleavage/methylation domain-containing protein